MAVAAIPSLLLGIGDFFSPVALLLRKPLTSLRMPPSDIFWRTQRIVKETEVDVMILMFYLDTVLASKEKM